MTTLLATGDIHLTNHPRDEYRWGIFPWLEEQADRRGVGDVVVLGDLTDKKDGHPSRLVNRLHDTLAKSPLTWWLMRGNHDYDVDPEWPFFRFLPQFINRPKVVDIGDLRCLFIPHVRKTDGHKWPKITDDVDMVFMHQTFKGAVAENGQRLPGLDPRAWDFPIVSGDVHVPQTIGNVTYAGAPHPIRFGDVFQPRVLYWDGTKWKSIQRTTIQKATPEITSIDALDRLDLEAGDQAKIKVRIPRRDFPSWPTIREDVIKWCKDHGVDLHGCKVEEDIMRARVPRDPMRTMVDTFTPTQLFEAFCDERDVDASYVKAGRAYVVGRP